MITLVFIQCFGNNFLEWVEVEDTYALSAVNTLQDAVHTILKFLGLGPANSTEKVPEATHTHTLLCSGECYYLLEVDFVDLTLKNVLFQAFFVVVLK